MRSAAATITRSTTTADQSIDMSITSTINIMMANTITTTIIATAFPAVLAGHIGRVSEAAGPCAAGERAASSRP